MIAYLEENRDKYLAELFDFLKIPSISADKKYSGNVHEAAAFVADKLKSAGADDVELCPTAGYPIIFGRKFVDERFRTECIQQS